MKVIGGIIQTTLTLALAALAAMTFLYIDTAVSQEAAVAVECAATTEACSTL